MASTPEIHFAQGDGGDVAYQVVGNGPIDLVLIPGWLSNLEVLWELPDLARYLDGLASFSRLILFDKRGSGLSDRLATAPTLEERGRDVLTVLDAIGTARAALYGMVDSGTTAVYVAATHPDRVTSLVLDLFAAKGTPDREHPWGLDPELARSLIDQISEHWGDACLAPVIAPSRLDDERFLTWFRRWERSSATPSGAAAHLRWNLELDVRALLPMVQAPTLLLQRTQPTIFDPRGSRWAAERIAGARYVEVEGGDAAPVSDVADGLLAEIQEFLTGDRPTCDSDRVLATVLFTDIVGSTEHARALGDRPWRDLLQTHHREIRRCIERFRGREIDTAGDGFFATFDGPARAVRCACAARDAVRSLGLEIRAGLHTGEVESHGDGVTGLAVHVGARVAAVAEAGEVVVTSTVKELVLGSGIDFEDRGMHELKGFSDDWHLYAVTS